MKPLIHALVSAAIAVPCALSVAAEPDMQPPQPLTQSYTPGLGEFMSVIQVRHAKLWFAGRGNNWQLAAYELGELKEGFADAAKYQPEFKGQPIAKIVEPMTAQPIAQLEEAIEAKDPVRFVKAYDNLSHACSACHQDTDHGFIVIQRPTSFPLTNQRFEIGRQQ